MAILLLTHVFAEAMSIALFSANVHATNPIAAASSRQHLSTQLNAATTILRRYCGGVGWTPHDNQSAEILANHIRTAINDLRQYY
jgi:hypothetical protein